MMSDPKTGQKSTSPATASPEAGPRRIDLSTILRGDREVIIAHGADEYRLRLTSNDKLLLTK
jgi:hemin uptake protein HemP